jgi:hypothetical protein
MSGAEHEPVTSADGVNPSVVAQAAGFATAATGGSSPRTVNRIQMCHFR